MSGPNSSELGKSQIQENPITRSQVRKILNLQNLLHKIKLVPLNQKEQLL